MLYEIGFVPFSDIERNYILLFWTLLYLIDLSWKKMLNNCIWMRSESTWMEVDAYRCMPDAYEYIQYEYLSTHIVHTCYT